MSVKSLLKRNRLVYRAALVARRLPYPLLTGLCALCRRVWGIEKGAVCFSSFEGMLYNDNPRAVAEALHALRPDARLKFILNRRGMAQPDIPEFIERVPRASLRALKVLSTSEVLVRNAKMRPWMRKFPGQFYVQTWHGDRGFKRVLLDRPDIGPENREFAREGTAIDLAVSGSAFGSRVYRSSMAYHGEILERGCPRNDLLVNHPAGLAARMRAALGIPEGTRALLYAPTFRNADTGRSQAAPLRLERVRETLEGATGERWVCLTRSHELVSGIRSDAWRDVSDWPETNEVLLAVDLLITDYSSIGGDFMLLERPVIYYQPDIGDYDGERGLYFDPDQSPLLTAHTEEALLALLSRPIDAPGNCRAVLEYFGANETGSAAAATARRIRERLGVR